MTMMTIMAMDINMDTSMGTNINITVRDCLDFTIYYHQTLAFRFWHSQIPNSWNNLGIYSRLSRSFTAKGFT